LVTRAYALLKYKYVIKNTAREYGLVATFMPKPLYGYNGSGMHTHMSLFKGDSNAFYDPDDKYHLSDTAKKFIAGLLRHAPEITLVCNQWVNSYKRLVPGYEAPVYLSWAVRNRSDLVRVPEYKPGKESATRLEFRSPDPACNPYLAFACMLSAGLEGIANDYQLADSVERNVYEMSEEERRELGIGQLPDDLWEAFSLAEKSELLRKTLGDAVFESLIENKKIEWERYRSQVTGWEMEQYLPVL
jgi:glutamine synthetase